MFLLCTAMLLLMFGKKYLKSGLYWNQLTTDLCDQLS